MPTLVVDKIAEEAREVAQAQTQAEREEEVGDLLFVVANLARHLKVDPEPRYAPPTTSSPAASATSRKAWLPRASSPAPPACRRWKIWWQDAKAREKASSIYRPKISLQYPALS